MIIEFTVPIIPVAKERPRHTKFHTYTPARTKEFERQVREYMKDFMYNGGLNGLPPLSSPLRLYVEFYLLKPRRPKFDEYPAIRPDTDNYLKAIMDAGNLVLWTDDSLICDVRAIKMYGSESKIVIRVEEL